MVKVNTCTFSEGAHIFNMKKEILEFLKEEIYLKHIPGAVIQVSYNGKILVREALGYRTFYPKKAFMNKNSIFDLASLTKVVATLPGILKLIERGYIHLDDPVRYYFPSFSQNDKNEIKIVHLLTHTSGLRSSRKFYIENIKPENILDEINKETLTYPVGKRVLYSDLGFIVLYKLFEKVTSQNFDEFLRKEIFEPLEMYETTFNPKFNENRFASTEYSNKLGVYKHGVVHDRNGELMKGVSGHAGLFSSVHDLGNFASMIENDGLFKNKQLLPENLIDLSRQSFTSSLNEYRGLGWVLKNNSSDLVSQTCGDLFSAKSYGHTGFTGTSIWFDPVLNLNVILLTNRVHFGRSDHILKIRSNLHNLVRSYF